MEDGRFVPPSFGRAGLAAHFESVFWNLSRGYGWGSFKEAIDIVIEVDVDMIR